MRIPTVVFLIVISFPVCGQNTSQITAYETFSQAESLYDDARYSQSISIISRLLTATTHSVEAKAKLYNLLAKNHLELSEYQSAMMTVKKVIHLNRDIVSIERVRACHTLARCYLKYYEYDSAIYWLNQGSVSIDDSLLISEYQEVFGEILLEKNLFDSARIKFNEALMARKDINSAHPRSLLSLYQHLALTNHHLTDYERALDFVRLAMEIQDTELRMGHPYRARTHLISGKINTSSGDFIAALKELTMAREVLAQSFDDVHLLYIEVINNLGTMYRNQGNFRLAFEHCNQSLVLAQKRQDPNPVLIANIYGSIANCHQEMGEYKKALELRLQGIEILENVLGPHHRITAINYMNLGNYFVTTGDFTNGIKYIRLARDSFRKIYGENHFFVADCHGILGVLYRLKKEHETALDQFYQALSICEKIYRKHYRVVISHLMIANTWRDLGELDSAITYYHKSSLANILNTNDPDIRNVPHVDDFLKADYLLTSLIRKADLFIRRYEQHMEQRDLIAALETYQVCDTLIDQIIRSQQHHEEKLSLGNLYTQTNQGAIKTCQKLYELTQERQYQQLTFHFSERNKSIILNDFLANLAAKSTGMIPGKILTKEKNLREDISKWRSEIIKVSAQHSMDSSRLRHAQIRLFNTERSLDSLMRKNEEKFPEYFNSKHAIEITTVSGVQDALSENLALIEFFETENYLYQMIITASTYQTFQLEKDSAINTIIEKIPTLFNSNKFQEVVSGIDSFFLHDAYLLYRFLFDNRLNSTLFESIDHLIIIPDGPLNYLPFEILITKKIHEPNYKRMDFLLKRFTISYGYNAQLSLKGDNRSVSLKKQLAFAPEYRSMPDSLQLVALGRFRNDLVPLKWNQKEVKSSSDIVNGDSYVGKLATESRFKLEAGKYEILHLAMHAFVDDEDPMNSKLVFTQESDTLEDGYLHSFELYNMQLNADLAILSACQTGYGEFVKGEGIMSLARGFSYAGVPNIITSLWQVSDYTTSDLMLKFYEEMDQNMPYPLALRNAKLRYLEEADQITANPYYWSTFVYIGHPDGSIPYAQTWKWITLLTVSLIVTGLLIRRNYYRKK